ncbi:hypothetical protein ANO11243_084660 [Dothideomycetidae sp. 11243]|nr:hypothetical protein ANO11243_084660 [fungal sp. No.11243]
MRCLRVILGPSVYDRCADCDTIRRSQLHRSHTNFIVTSSTTRDMQNAVARTRTGHGKVDKETRYPSPKATLIARLPASWIPYAQLMRLDRPAGFNAFYFPHLIGLAYAASIAKHTVPWTELGRYVVLTFLWSILLRGVACTWNDNVDQDFDRRVERCRNRPIARGAVSTTQAHAFTILLALASVALLAAFPRSCHGDAAIMTLLFFVYPFGKRFTFYPQLILGFPFATAILIASHALDVDPWTAELLTPTACLCLSMVVWTMIYDTIYAHQDLEDDIKAGVKSMAVRFQHNTKPMTSMLASVFVALLATAGYILDLDSVYYVVTCGGTGLALASMIALVDLGTPNSCAWWFNANFYLVGGIMFLERLGAYATRAQWDGKCPNELSSQLYGDWSLDL